MDPVKRLDLIIFDEILKLSTSDKPAQEVVVIDIDDNSLSAIGQWPWPRYRVAMLVHALAEEKPSAIGVDILFPEPDRTSLDSVQKSFKQDFGLDISISGAPPELQDNDGFLGSVLAQTSAVGANYFFFDQSNKIEIIGKSETSFTGRTDLLKLHDATGILNNNFKIASQLKFTGFINTQFDDDGMLRRLPLLLKYKDTIYPHLTLATFMRSLGVTSASIETTPHGLVIQVKSHAIPIEENGTALLRIRGKPDLYPSISAVDVLSGTFPAGSIKGKAVIIGSSAAGTNDLHSTIFDSQFPGTKIQAVMIENMMSDYFSRVPSWGGTAIVLLCITCGLLISAMSIYSPSAIQMTLGAACLTGVLFLAFLALFYSTGMLFPLAAPLLTVMVLFTTFAVIRYAIEKRLAYLRLKKFENAKVVMFNSLAIVTEMRDQETGAHLLRTQHYVKAIAKQLMHASRYSKFVTPEYIDLLFLSAPLHDVGKVGVPDNILLKPCKLNEDERLVMMKHAEFGEQIIYKSKQNIEGDDFLKIAGEIASTHHEKWDGTGYPAGLAGEAIPLSGRIMAVADIYDALINKRCYKHAFPHEEAIAIIRESRGSCFDPEVVDAFLEIEETIIAIAATFKDKPITHLQSAPVA